MKYGQKMNMLLPPKFENVWAIARGDHLVWPCRKVARLQQTFVMKLALISWVWQNYLPTCFQCPKANHHFYILQSPPSPFMALTPSRIAGDKCSVFDPSMVLFTIGYRNSPVEVSPFLSFSLMPPGTRQHVGWHSHLQTFNYNLKVWCELVQPLKYSTSSEEKVRENPDVRTNCYACVCFQEESKNKLRHNISCVCHINEVSTSILLNRALQKVFNVLVNFSWF